MQRCESAAGDGCTQTATWKQLVHEGVRAGISHTLFSYWCNKHAEEIVTFRRMSGLPPPSVSRLSARDPETAPNEQRRPLKLRQRGSDGRKATTEEQG